MLQKVVLIHYRLHTALCLQQLKLDTPLLARFFFAPLPFRQLFDNLVLILFPRIGVEIGLKLAYPLHEAELESITHQHKHLAAHPGQLGDQSHRNADFLLIHGPLNQLVHQNEATATLGVI